jgi:hypothetical protein
MMKPEIQAVRAWLGPSQREGHAKYIVPKLAGFSTAEVDLICEMAERGIHELLKFCLDGPCKPGAPGVFVQRPLTERNLKIAMRRFIAVAWMLHSEMLVGAKTDKYCEPIPLTLEQIGKIPQIDCTKVALSLLAKRFGAQFNLHTRVQKRQGSRETYSGAAKGGWAKRRARVAEKQKLRAKQAAARKRKRAKKS